MLNRGKRQERGHEQRRRMYFLICGVAFSSAIMRSPITGVSSLLNEIKADFSLSGALAGSITTIPTIVFALFSLTTPLLLKKWNAYSLMLMGMICIFAGILIRSYLGLPGFFAGTVLVGAGIGLGNILIPKIIKQDFANSVERYTGLYAALINLFAAVAAGISVPIANAAGWQHSLALWCVPVLIAAPSWGAAMRVSKDGGMLYTALASLKAILKSRIAWKLTFCMGFQSIAYFSIIAWLPSILQFKGMDAGLAGYGYLLMQLCGMISSFAMPLIMKRLSDQRPSIIATCAIAFLGLILLYIFPDSVIWQLLMLITIGIGTGTGLSYTLTVLTLRAASSDEVVTASVLVQTGGYVIAALGPVLLGGLFDIFKTMDAMVGAMALFMIGYMVFGSMSALRPGGGRGLVC